MNTSTAVVVGVLGLAVIGTAGFFGYAWWKNKQQQQTISTVTSTAQSAWKGFLDYQKAQQGGYSAGAYPDAGASSSSGELMGAYGVQILR